MGTTTTAKERPILFSAPMVNAILAGRKTQTRRIIGPQPIAGSDNPLVIPHPACGGSAVVFRGPGGLDSRAPADQRPGLGACRFGQPGERLWVRETWRTAAGLDVKSPDSIAKSCLDAGYPRPWAPIRYEADGRTADGQSLADFDKPGATGWGKTRVSIHMPRWASRIILEITDIRVERLQGISPKDAEAEGVDWNKGPLRCGHTNPISAFRSLWEAINGPDSWHASPWVWVISFERLTPEATP